MNRIDLIVDNGKLTDFVRVTFSEPIPEESSVALQMILFFGSYHGSAVVIEKGQVIGYNLKPFVWAEFLEANNAEPGQVEEFYKVVEELKEDFKKGKV